MEITQILVSHRAATSAEQCAPKWGRMSISQWIEQEFGESTKNAWDFENEIYNMAQDALNEPWLLHELEFSKQYYYDVVSMTDEHRKKFSTIKQRIAYYDITINLSPMLLSRQGDDPQWHKGGIKINHRFQYIKWACKDNSVLDALA